MEVTPGLFQVVHYIAYFVIFCSLLCSLFVHLTVFEISYTPKSVRGETILQVTMILIDRSQLKSIRAVNNRHD